MREQGFLHDHLIGGGEHQIVMRFNPDDAGTGILTDTKEETLVMGTDCFNPDDAGTGILTFTDFIPQSH